MRSPMFGSSAQASCARDFHRLGEYTEASHQAIFQSVTSALAAWRGCIVGELEQLLAASRAAESFKCAVRSYHADKMSDRIAVAGYAPPIKVKRLLKHVLHAEPELPIERVTLRARSGCSDFVGIIDVETAHGRRSFEFVWDCRWRAMEEGWNDYFGFPDQIRAAQEFDWQCFKHWKATRT